MRRRTMIALGVCAIVAAMVPLVVGAGGDDPPASERMVIKICNWEGVVPVAALNGFKLPAGKWAEFQQQGWELESYLVAPGDDRVHGFYAVLKR